MIWYCWYCSPKRLQKTLTALNHTLNVMGMSFNATKCKGLTILKDRRRKCLVLSPTCYQIDDGLINHRQMDDRLRYLGLEFTWKGRCTPKHTQKLQGMLTEISKAPLKPYQRLEILKTFAAPKLIHELVLGATHRNTLKKMDTLVRSAVRAWLRLAKDTPLGYLHTPISDGGIGIPCFHS